MRKSIYSTENSIDDDKFLTVCQNSHVSEKRRKKLMITLFSSLSLWKIFTISLEMNLRQKKERKKFVVECKLTPLCTFLIFFSCYVLCLMSSKRENEPLLAGRLIWGFDVYFFFLHQIHASSYTQRIESI